MVPESAAENVGAGWNGCGLRGVVLLAGVTGEDMIYPFLSPYCGTFDFGIPLPS